MTGRIAKRPRSHFSFRDRVGMLQYFLTECLRQMRLCHSKEGDIYKVIITEQMLYKCGGEIRVWDTPRSLADGAELLDVLTEPIEAIAIEEQLECYGAGLQRIKIRYGDEREGWVLDEAVEKT